MYQITLDYTQQPSFNLAIPEATENGFQIQFLNQDPALGPTVYVMTLQPDAVIPAHFHQKATETFLVLEGTFVDDGKEFAPGTYFACTPGTVHGPHSSVGGCKLLVFQSEQVDPTDFFIAGKEVPAPVPVSDVEVAKRFVVECLGGANFSAFDELVDENVVAYTGLKPTAAIRGREEYKSLVAKLGGCFEDASMRIDSAATTSDGRVVVSFTAQGRHTGSFYGEKPSSLVIPMVETHVMTIKNGKIVENHVGANMPAVLEALSSEVVSPQVLSGTEWWQP